jgi:quinol monooxygenase YgiN
MVRSVLVLHALPGRREDVTALFDRLQILREASAIPGFLGAELDASADDPDELLVTATWESGAAYGAWLESPVRERMRAPLEMLLAETPQPRVYEQVKALA